MPEEWFERQAGVLSNREGRCRGAAMCRGRRRVGRGAMAPAGRRAGHRGRPMTSDLPARPLSSAQDATTPLALPVVNDRSGRVEPGFCSISRRSILLHERPCVGNPLLAGGDFLARPAYLVLRGCCDLPNGSGHRSLTARVPYRDCSTSSRAIRLAS